LGWGYPYPCPSEIGPIESGLPDAYNGYELVTENRRNHHRREVRDMLFAPKEKGQGLVEYALILVLVAVVVIVILALLGPAIGNVFSNIVTNI
jgi:pilus assembly protein Flp/PilA